MVAAISSSVASRPIAATGLGNNFGGQRTDRVHAENLAVLFVGDHFDEAFMLTQNGGLAVAQERKLSDLHFDSQLRAPAFP